MSDALTAASMINNTLHAYQIGEFFTATRARNDDAVEIARLQALVQRLADYGRYVEQQHNSLLTEAQSLDSQRCQQINAQQSELTNLQRQNNALRLELAEVSKKLASEREASLEIGKSRVSLLMEAGQLERRVAALEAENASLREASSSD